MDVLIRGRESTLKFLRSSSALLVSSLTVADTTSGGSVCTCAITNDDTSETLNTSVSLGSSTIDCDNLVASTVYELTTNTGKVFSINVIGVDGSTVELSDNIPMDIDEATIKGLESTGVFTVPDTYEENSVALEWVLDDDSLSSDECIVSKYKISITNVLSSSDLYIRWSRLKNNEPSYQRTLGVEYAPQIQAALEMLRERFWLDNIVLDTVRSPKQLKELITLQTGLILVSLGMDLSATNDLSESREALQREMKDEINRIYSATNFWRDENGDGVKEDSETKQVGWKATW